MPKSFQSDKVWIEGGDASNPLPVTNVSQDGESGVALGGDNRTIDAFGRLRVSNPTGLFESQQQYDLSPALWETSAAGAGGTEATHLPNESSVLLTVGGANSTLIRQTRKYFYYQPGKSLQIMLTFVAAPPAAGLTQRFGYFDAQNGVFVEVTPTQTRVVLRSFVTGSVVDNAVAQADWNIDKMNGTGPSGVTLDMTKAQILLMDLEWLGVGRVRIGFVIDGIPYYVHEFLHANIETAVYMTTANLPIRYEIRSDGTFSGTASARQICSQISSEGGVEFERGYLFTTSNGTTRVPVTTRRPILSVRPKLTFNGVTNRVFSIKEDISLYCEDASIYAEVVYGGTLTGASWADVNSSFSSMERSVDATGITGGISIFSWVQPAATQVFSRLLTQSLIAILTRYPLTLNIAGAHPTTPLTDNLSIVCTSVPGAQALCIGSLAWREVR